MVGNIGVLARVARLDMSSDHAPSVETASPTIEGSGPEHARRAADLLELMEVIGPAVEADGGTLRLVSADTDTGRVTVELAGACGSCAVASQTLEGGIARILRQRLDWITDVAGTVDDDPAATGWGGWTPRS
jgi:Fe-S cluster biogenesis protein NfuA